MRKIRWDAALYVVHLRNTVVTNVKHREVNLAASTTLITKIK